MGTGKRTVSLADVAAAAGVSTATASRALNRPDMVAEPTRTLVTDAANELGFQANRAARALITGETGLVGMIVPTLANPYFAPMILGAQEAAAESGCHVLVVSCEHSAEHEQLLIDRLAAQVDGFIMVAPRETDAAIRRLARKCPLVLVDRRVGTIPAVIIDTAGGIGALADHLVALGHRSVTYLGGPEGSWIDQRRREALRERELSVDELGPVPPSFDAGVESVRRLDARAGAVIAYNSSVTLGLLHGLQAGRCCVPEQLSLASADDLTALGVTTPAITGLRVPVETAGRTAMALFRRVLGGDRPRRPERIATELVVRDSTNAPPNTGS